MHNQAENKPEFSWKDLLNCTLSKKYKVRLAVIILSILMVVLGGIAAAVYFTRPGQEEWSTSNITTTTEPTTTEEMTLRPQPATESPLTDPVTSDIYAFLM